MEILMMVGIGVMVITNAYALREVRRCYKIMESLYDRQDDTSQRYDRLVAKHNDLCHDVAKSIRAGDFDSEEIEDKKVEESMQFFGY
jgi:hypothetical protein